MGSASGCARNPYATTLQRERLRTRGAGCRTWRGEIRRGFACGGALRLPRRRVETTLDSAGLTARATNACPATLAAPPGMGIGAMFSLEGYPAGYLQLARAPDQVAGGCGSQEGCRRVGNETSVGVAGAGAGPSREIRERGGAHAGDIGVVEQVECLADERQP